MDQTHCFRQVQYLQKDVSTMKVAEANNALALRFHHIRYQRPREQEAEKVLRPPHKSAYLHFAKGLSPIVHWLTCARACSSRHVYQVGSGIC